MALTAKEKEQLLLAIAADLAKRRLKRGEMLDYSQSTALIITEMRESARNGASVEELQKRGRSLLNRNQVMPGIPEMLAELHVEVPDVDSMTTIKLYNPIYTVH
ncbi:urease subunit gamma [Paenibacillus oryzae]|uniref:Urease subunit gamma n=1 Tax=Paenibacillus oryzae TaxID=1844972 RepID=A0A1A5YJQ7_9BACL|nr:urease subunit gamma [Paenibacillus oryzae]OBR65851.1 urease subunit gamma [Paenibacillus oryzae]